MKKPSFVAFCVLLVLGASAQCGSDSGVEVENNAVDAEPAEVIEPGALLNRDSNECHYAGGGCSGYMCCQARFPRACVIAGKCMCCLP
ncbi:hypothetical protein BDV39DRAFT_128852 [Aspergillus sergii]|uniref:Uncharacterized protein n=1 Tax=Aspergillus sergii TaxID=1034303 RepID=A0A5N6WTH9_9EURO|nr:hypothetical protein BDV39DRAFT_128852 [Aspergillus sergii]